jgi:hypothetical protein
MMCQELFTRARGHLHSAHACLLLSRGLTSTRSFVRPVARAHDLCGQHHSLSGWTALRLRVSVCATGQLLVHSFTQLAFRLSKSTGLGFCPEIDLERLRAPSAAWHDIAFAWKSTSEDA